MSACDAQQGMLGPGVGRSRQQFPAWKALTQRGEPCDPHTPRGRHGEAQWVTVGPIAAGSLSPSSGSQREVTYTWRTVGRMGSRQGDGWCSWVDRRSRAGPHSPSVLLHSRSCVTLVQVLLLRKRPAVRGGEFTGAAYQGASLWWRVKLRSPGGFHHPPSWDLV